MYRNGRFAQTPMHFVDPRTDAAALFSDVQFSALLFERLVGPLTPQWTALDGVESLRVPMSLAHGLYDYAVPMGELVLERRRALLSNQSTTNPEEAAR